MCTVTLVPTQKNDFILTSNRDETINRNTLPPEFYTIKSTRMLFPKDAVAGGTWIGLSDQNSMVCLLNGGFTFHERKLPYKKSRGVVVTDLLTAANINEAIISYDYRGIEPFTIIAADWNSDLIFYELIWDGKYPHFKTLQKGTYIWSSSTLYTKDMKAMRERWFRDHEDNNHLNPDTMLNFHRNAGVGDSNLDLQIDRGFLKTRSITQIVKRDEELTMRYENLMNKKVNSIAFERMAV